ncbi:uncharacterized protein HKW66_Vig0111880 [Vigna angularis]|uniref:Uncharacterized protein n=1 Tax=Phaseolus angularis TaxID=3914 RepID=A0A8T0KWZ4_PHAAN|nr:uncharacterized protein HKW66_Vig0111880 [Vigna angularis]
MSRCDEGGVAAGPVFLVSRRGQSTGFVTKGLSLREKGFDYREGGYWTADTPRGCRCRRGVFAYVHGKGETISREEAQDPAASIQQQHAECITAGGKRSHHREGMECTVKKQSCTHMELLLPQPGVCLGLQHNRHGPTREDGLMTRSNALMETENMNLIVNPHAQA